MEYKLINDRRLHIIFSITMIAVLGVASLTPAFPKMEESLHISKVQIGLLISAFTLPGIILTPLLGVIADRIGRKKILVPSLFIFAVSGFCIFLIHDFRIIIILRFFQGIGAASLGSLNTTLVGDFFKGEQRPAAMGYNAGILNVSTGLYPLIGGSLATFAWYYPFILPLLAIPVGLFVLFALPEPEIKKTADMKKYFHAISRNIIKKEVLGIFIIGIITFLIIYGAFITYMPFLLHQRFGFSSAKIGLIISLSSLVAALVSTQLGKLSKRFGNLNLLKTAFLLYIVASVFFIFAHSFYFLIFSLIIYGTAQALNMPSVQTILANIAPDDQRAAFMSLNGMILRIGQTLGPIIIGIGYSLYNLPGAYLFSAIVSVIGLIVAFTMISEHK